MQSTVEVIADSVGPNGKRITTLLCVYPRIIHAEHLRHRMMSFSVASSRAIPAEKVLEQVKNDPFIQIRFQKAHKGMQGSEYINFRKDNTYPDMNCHEDCVTMWLEAKREAVIMAEKLSKRGVTKQLVNRLLEPWVMTRCVVTATEWDGFFQLRHPWYKFECHDCREPYMSITEGFKCKCGCPIFCEMEFGEAKLCNEPMLTFPAEIHIQDLAIKMKKAMNASTPTKLEAGLWHLPFVTSEEQSEIALSFVDVPEGSVPKEAYDCMIKLSAARCAMTSYNTNKGRSIEMELELADRLIKENHWSPFEHQAMAIRDVLSEFPMDGHRSLLKEYKGLEIRIKEGSWRGYDLSYEVWSRNLQGWIQARATLDGE